MTSFSKIEVLKEACSEAVWPTRCCICDKPGYLLCPTCAGKLTFVDHLKSCHRCGEPFGAKQCCACMSKPSFDKCISATVLTKDTGRIITLFKDAGERRLANIMSYFMARVINPAWITENTYLTYIPATKEAFNKRGFDHCEVLALALANRLGVKLLRTFKRPKSVDQRNLGRKLRMQNLAGRFEILNKDFSRFTRPKTKIILIDDVFTTGSTLNTACQTLKSHGFSTIYCVNFSRTF